MRNRFSTFTAMALLLAISSTAGAQQITGTPGSPSATTTIPGDQLPAPPSKFGGWHDRMRDRAIRP